uniref:Ovule protein n=1 Tax=Loa loa TaxID=7209 RepID=A0A1I7V798_LOALO
MPQQPPTNISCSAASISTSIHYPTKSIDYFGELPHQESMILAVKKDDKFKHHSMPPSKLVGPWQMNLRSKG